MTMHDLEPTLAEAAALLAAASVVDVETDRGESVELWTISSEGQSVAASAPRLSVASGMLRAAVCDRIPPGERLPVRIVDLSESGVGVLVEDIRPRPGDRMWLTARFIEGELGADLR